MMSPETRAEALALTASMRHDLRRLTLRGPGGQQYAVPLKCEWGALPGREGVLFYHVPAPDGSEGLHAAHFVVDAGACYTGSIIEQSRLLVIGSGVITCNGRAYGPGASLWLAPGQPTSWHSETGCEGVVFYNIPNPISSTP